MKPKLTIVQIAPPEETVPPPKYGGTELVVHNLTEELVKRGHNVYLIAAADSKTSAKLLPIFPRSIRSYPDASLTRRREILRAISTGIIVKHMLSIEADIAHNHWGWRVIPFFDVVKYPFITTLHGRMDQGDQQMAHGYFKNTPFTAISEDQRRADPELNYVATVYNGINMGYFSWSDKKDDYYAFLGRISPEKGPKETIVACKRAGVKLKMAAKVDPIDDDFFNKEIKPLIDGKQIEFLGEIGPTEKNDFLRNAIALIAPIQWPEPFGLYFIESMASGTPVIAFDRGSVPEIIAHGQTGYIVEKNNMEELVRAIRRLSSLANTMQYRWMSRKCRERVSEKFTKEIMTDDYEKTYYKIIQEQILSKAGFTS